MGRPVTDAPLPSVGVVMAARDEEESVRRVLDSLGAQTLTPSVVVVVDDGSMDGTRDVLARARGSLPFDLEVVSLPRHPGSYVGRPELARVLNAGLSALKSPPLLTKYVMKLDGDHSLPPDYLRMVVERMEADPRLVVASGYISGERYTPTSPRGSGMVVRTDFWVAAGGLRFPLEYGWESWLYLKARATGYRTRSFRDIVTSVSRPTSFSKGVLYGRGMYALGYFWPYAVGRCLLVLPRSPAGAFQMLRGYVDHRGVTPLDVSSWVGRMQRGALLRRGVGVVAHMGLS
jgi:glycosyltransferase involved in cell wall biosynthesis